MNFLLFMRFLPMICMFEVKAVKPEADAHYHPGHEPSTGPGRGASPARLTSLPATEGHH